MPILSYIIEKDIAIDLGTDTTILYVAGIGIRLREPTVVTIDRTTGPSVGASGILRFL